MKKTVRRLWAFARAKPCPGLALPRVTVWRLAVHALGLVLLWGMLVPTASWAASTSATGSAALAAAEGVLEIVIEDHPGVSRTRHFLKTDSARLELKFSGQFPNVRAGARLRVKGQLSGTVMQLGATDANAVTAVAPAPVLNAIGEQRTVVLLANFSDDTRQPYTAAQAQDVVFAQTNGFVRENSSQKAWLAGGTFGWYTLPIPSTCDGFAIASYAKNAAASAGVDLSGYSRFIFVIPANPVCGWTGQTAMGGSGYMWVNGKLELLVVGHEFGHSMGLYHGHALECGTSTLGSGCTTLEYGDTLNIMGNNVAAHFDAFDKARLGWLSSESGALKTVSASGSYFLDAYASAGIGNPKALKIPKGLDPATGAQTWYYVEYRQPVGYDAPLANIYATNVKSGVVVRTGDDGNINSSNLLDMTPDSSFYTDWFDPALVFGRSFSDPASGVTITSVSGDGSRAQVDVSFGAPSGCVRANPSTTMTGGASAVPAGSTVNYGVSVANNDSLACGASTFLLTPMLPSGWSGTLSASSLAVSPGSTATVTRSVTSPATAPAGLYGVGTDVANAAATGYRMTAPGSYSVGSIAALLTTSVATNQTTYQVGDLVRATARVLAGSAPVANASVRFVYVKSNGSTIEKTAATDASGTASSSYRTSRKDPPGAWRVEQSATSGAASATSTSAFTVQ